MTDYSKVTNFTAKDNLAEGDASKRINGALFDSEFNPISTAIASKIDKVAGQTSHLSVFTSNGGLASSGITLTELYTAIYTAVYPVGSIYSNAAVATNPGTLLGFGTWETFGAGRVMVGLDSGDTSFDVLEETGGSKTHTLTVAETPAHDHDSPWVNGSGATDSTLYTGRTTTAPLTVYEDIVNADDTYGTISVGEKIYKTTSVGDGDAHNILQPYITVYMWKRTA